LVLAKVEYREFHHTDEENKEVLLDQQAIFEDYLGRVQHEHLLAANLNFLV